MNKHKEEYQIIRTGAGVFEQDNIGIILIRGDEGKELLHRISTNDIKSMLVGDVKRTILINEKGRVIDVVTVCCFQKFLLLITGESSAIPVKMWIERFIVMEDITLEDLSSNFHKFTVIGNESESFLQNFNPSMTAPTINKFAYLSDNINNVVSCLAVRDERFLLPAYSLLLSKKSPQIEFSTSDVALLELFEMENGIPKLGSEFSLEYNPLEAGLEKSISFSKGCYVGQEVIARLDTYKKVQKHLRGFSFGQHEPHTSEIIYDGSGEAGFITRTAFSYARNEYIALGFLLSRVEEKESLSLNSSGIEHIPVYLQTLPFSLS